MLVLIEVLPTLKRTISLYPSSPPESQESTKMLSILKHWLIPLNGIKESKKNNIIRCHLKIDFIFFIFKRTQFNIILYLRAMLKCI